MFIGSCTNSRLNDLEAAASFLKGRKVNKSVRMLVVPGSESIKREAEKKGIDKIFNREQDDVRTDQVLQSEGQDSSDKVSDFLAKAQWLEDTRNSPAQRSGAFTDDELWQQQLKHRQWLEYNNRI